MFFREIDQGVMFREIDQGVRKVVVVAGITTFLLAGYFIFPWRVPYVWEFELPWLPEEQNAQLALLWVKGRQPEWQDSLDDVIEVASESGVVLSFPEEVSKIEVREVYLTWSKEFTLLAWATEPFEIKEGYKIEEIREVRDPPRLKVYTAWHPRGIGFCTLVMAISAALVGICAYLAAMDVKKWWAERKAEREPPAG